MSDLLREDSLHLNLTSIKRMHAYGFVLVFLCLSSKQNGWVSNELGSKTLVCKHLDKNHTFLKIHAIRESVWAHYYMEGGDINIPESIFESPLLQIALENIPCPRSARFFSEGFSGWKIFTSEQFFQKSFTPTKIFQLTAKR